MGADLNKPRNIHSHGVGVSNLQIYHIIVQCPDLNKNHTAHKQEESMAHL